MSLCGPGFIAFVLYDVKQIETEPRMEFINMKVAPDQKP